MTNPCSRCNQINPADASFCLNCAAPLGSRPPFIGAQAAGQPGSAWPGSNAASDRGGAGQKATIALGLAVAALICCGPIAGVPAAIVGWMELDSIKNGRSSVDGKWMAQTGLWVGLIASIIHVAGYMLFVLMGALSSDPYAY